MMQITGVISDKNGKAMEDVTVILKNEYFEDVVCTTTNAKGEYFLDAEDKNYSFMIAVKDYGEKYLEYWCQNINLSKDLVINASIDKLEIYGLHCFRVKGAYPSLMVYFRPMSLEKFLRKEKDISPNMIEDSIKVSINNENVDILKLNKVEEYIGQGHLTAYLMQVSLPKNLETENGNFLDIKILDLDKLLGQASIFF